MAVRLNGASSLSRTANLPPGQNSYTACGWATISVDRDAFSTVVSVNAGGNGEHILCTDTDGTTLRLWSNVGFAAGTFAPGVGVPFFWAITGNGTNAIAYFRTAAQNAFTVITGTGNPYTLNGVHFGDNTYSEFLNGLLWGIKLWDRSLSAAELLIESFFERPQFPTGLNLWWPLRSQTDLADRSGNGRNPTVSGTLGVGDNAGTLWSPSARIFLAGSTGPGSPRDLAGTAMAEASATAALEVAKRLSASAAAQAAAAGALNKSAPLAGGAVAQASSGASMLKGVSLSAVGLANANSIASMAHKVPLTAGAAAVASAGADLVLAVTLGAQAIAQAASSASLSTSASNALAADARAQAGGIAVLSLSVRLSASAVAQAVASAAMAVGKRLSAAAAAQATGAAALSVSGSNELAAAAKAQAGASAELALDVPLNAAALAQAQAAGSLAVVLVLRAGALVEASATAALDHEVMLSAAGQAVASAVGVLTVIGQFARAPAGTGYHRPFSNSTRPVRVQTQRRPRR